MASSVSSERAFSSAGITISKLRNRLKGDIVEALQFLKCTIRSELLYSEPAPSLVLEEMLEAEEEQDAKDAVESAKKKPKGWDTLVIDDSDDELD
jgi:3'-phosphoadenosine 5'-phosphosulfate sulfotransferase